MSPQEPCATASLADVAMGILFTLNLRKGLFSRCRHTENLVPIFNSRKRLYSQCRGGNLSLPLLLTKKLRQPIAGGTFTSIHQFPLSLGWHPIAQCGVTPG